VIEGGGGLSTICGFGFIKREKKLAHISIRFFIVNPYKFRFFLALFLALMKRASIDSVHTCTLKISSLQRKPGPLRGTPGREFF
jgi:hypothetical protein